MSLPGFGKVASRWPRQAAGFSPARNRSALATFKTRSMRARTREAVSGLDCQIGERQNSTPAVSTRSIGKFKIGSPKSEQDYIVNILKTYYDGKRPGWLDRENEYEVAGVDGFWMAKYTVTQSQYVRLTGKKNPSWFSVNGNGNDKVQTGNGTNNILELGGTGHDNLHLGDGWSEI